MSLAEQEINIGTIPDPAVDQLLEHRAFYTQDYTDPRVHDSSQDSRKSLVNRLKSYTLDIFPNKKILDIGSGKQILEQEMGKCGKTLQIMTLDIADLERGQLLGNPSLHMQANGCRLPFPDCTFNIGISNLALDLMPPEAIDELYRVLEFGGHAILNLNHSSLLLPFGMEEMGKKLLYREKIKKGFGSQLKPNDQLRLATYRYHKYLSDTGKLFQSKEEIQTAFGQKGFNIAGVSVGRGTLGSIWWEVDLQKPDK